jgi:hypothetical protein
MQRTTDISAEIEDDVCKLRQNDDIIYIDAEDIVEALKALLAWAEVEAGRQALAAAAPTSETETK